MTGFSEWVIVLLGARSLLGKPESVNDADRLRLSPIYELAVQSIVTPKGPASTLTVRPILLLASLQSLEVPGDSIMVPVATLSPGDQTELEAKVDAAEAYSVSRRTGLTL